MRYGEYAGQQPTIELLHDMFRTVEAMNPSKNANTYWQAINRVLLDADHRIGDIWREEKIASLESMQLARDEAFKFLASERERIMRLSREEAIKEVIKSRKIENRIRAVQSVADNGLLEIV